MCPSTLRLLLKALAILWLLGANALFASVQWMPVTYPDLIRGSDLIVVGKIASIREAAHDLGATDCGQVAITRVLRGSLDGSGPINLDFPAATRTTAPDGTVVRSHGSSEIFFEANQEGIWFLRRDPTSGCYMASHPARFKPILFLPEVEGEIRKLEP